MRMSELASIIDGIFVFGAMRVKQTRRLYETSRGRVVNVQFAFSCDTARDRIRTENHLPFWG